MVLGSNWYLFNQIGVTPNAGQAVQNADGSITCSPNNVADGSGFGGCICTTQKVGSTWAGQAFGGGLYIEATIKFPPTLGAAVLPFPAFWALDIGELQGAPPQWPGQAAGYIHRAELDIMQWPHNSGVFYIGIEFIDWYGPAFSNSIQSLKGVTITGTAGQFSCTNPTPFSLVVGAFVTVSGTFGGTGSITGYANPTNYKISATNGSTTFTLTTTGGGALTTTAGTPTGLGYQVNSLGQPTPNAGASVKVNQSATVPPLSLANYNRFGCLWIPATATTQGSLTNYFNGNPVIYVGVTPYPSPLVWNLYNSALAPPPVIGTSAISILDTLNMSFILGTDITCPMTIASVQVWQSSNAANIIQ